MNLFLKYTFWVFLFITLAFSSCRKNVITTDMNDKLSFSADTLKFDTVFTARGSATREFKVYNPHNNPIIISKIGLGGGGNSPYRLNVDGVAASSHTDVRIEANDSIYVFTEVTIDPNIGNIPFIVKDSVLFETNGNPQQVNLEAFGQDANYVGTTGELSILTCGGGTRVWNDPKPYVVLGFLLVDSCGLIIEAGTRVHFQGGTVFAQGGRLPSGLLYVTSNGYLDVRGQLNNPVRFLTDRIEPEFEDVPGQWGGIILDKGSTGNVFDYAEIRNSNVGILVDSAADLTISNSIIYEATNSGLLGIHSQITASNCLIYDVGQNNVQLVYGGTHKFYNCTFANFATNPFISHQEMVVLVNNFFVVEYENGSREVFENDANVLFENCIVYGSRSDEVALYKLDDAMADLNFTFDHCLIKADTLNTSTSAFINPVFDDPLFVDEGDYDYRLDTMISPAIDAGRTPSISLPVDLDGNSRVGDTDIGAYEFQF